MPAMGNLDACIIEKCTHESKSVQRRVMKPDGCRGKVGH